MENSTRSSLIQPPLVIGAILIAVMTLLLGILVFIDPRNDKISFANHAILGFYLICLLIYRPFKDFEYKKTITAMLVVMVILDAFAMNYQIEVLPSLASWYGYVLVLSCINVLVISFFQWLPEWLKIIVAFVTGVLFLAPLTPVITMLPITIIGLIAMVFLAIGIVAFAPYLLLLYYTLFTIKRLFPVIRYRMAFLAGLSSVLILIIFYCSSYVSTKNEIEKQYEQAYASTTDELPAWLIASQSLSKTSMTERILKTNITYQSIWTNASFGVKSQDEKVHYDPLFALSSLLFGECSLTYTAKYNMLYVMYDKQHLKEDRLWSGDDLVTSNVTTKADIWPEYHLAYTEHTLTVTNNTKETWSTDKEAIYTFHMPPGAVVTSLSLWVNNKEEKGILTTTHKADSAYKDIVGVQRRDPSLVHWREGDRVAVRVFPVQKGKSRVFKIGITSPLQSDHQQLTYQPSWFEGPEAENATYDVQLSFSNLPKEIIKPTNSFTTKNQTISRIGRYAGDWNMRFTDPGLGNAAFMFDNKRYTLLPFKPTIVTLNPDKIYLDLNSSWKYSDYTQLLKATSSKEVYVYDRNEWIRVTAANKEEVFNIRHSLRFSFFPFHKMPTPNGLVVTAGDKHSPFLSDIDVDGFSSAVQNYLRANKPKVFSLGDISSQFIATLRSRHLLTYSNGTITDLVSQLSQHSFSTTSADSNRVDIPGAKITVAQTPDSVATNGPDHLARLFAYNWLLEKSAVANPDDDALIDIASKAYVVSPVSSLIVLETRQDYEKHNIKDNESSLKNAILKGHGSVPEPHEWALFIIAVSILAYVRYNKIFSGTKAKVC
ncbi:XrtN system VIT domain-containing protein [Chitinophaga silvatica]|uniref:XrtN system VIT domain-containing protein n=1 Tax=Chitinophaga silvatica TaxID=2282649 RepID=A0A3E1YG70_9BACT|nr:XrtN system VIT domain-containing protein [Chitinophaga silvatica]RFS26403.1 XrtN system VIT domain-containing protein [Chitinophaga silvatica]